MFGLGCDAVLLGESLGYALDSGKFFLQEFEPLRLHLLGRFRIVPEASQSLGVDLFPTQIRALPLDYFVDFVKPLVHESQDSEYGSIVSESLRKIFQQRLQLLDTRLLLGRLEYLKNSIA